MRLVPQVFDVEAFAWQGWRLFAGGSGLERVLASLWPEVPTQCCTVHYADVRIMPTSGAEPA